MTGPAQPQAAIAALIAMRWSPQASTVPPERRARPQMTSPSGSYKDMTRVAWLNAPMWAELFLENRDNMLHELDCLMDRLMEYRAAIADDDAAALTQLLEDGKKRKEEVDGR